MTRRNDKATAEKPPIAILTKAAFGIGAGLQAALQMEVIDALVETVFIRPATHIRDQSAGPHVLNDRRMRPR